MANKEMSQFTDLPNVGKSAEQDLMTLGFTHPGDLVGQDPYAMYDQLCILTGKHQDPCVIDVFMSAIRYIEGEPAQKWWAFTAERKATLSNRAAL